MSSKPQAEKSIEFAAMMGPVKIVMDAIARDTGSIIDRRERGSVMSEAKSLQSHIVAGYLVEVGSYDGLLDISPANMPNLPSQIDRLGRDITKLQVAHQAIIYAEALMPADKPVARQAAQEIKQEVSLRLEYCDLVVNAAECQQEAVNSANMMCIADVALDASIKRNVDQVSIDERMLLSYASTNHSLAEAKNQCAQAALKSFEDGYHDNKSRLISKTGDRSPGEFDDIIKKSQAMLVEQHQNTSLIVREKMNTHKIAKEKHAINEAKEDDAVNRIQGSPLLQRLGKLSPKVASIGARFATKRQSIAEEKAMISSKSPNLSRMALSRQAKQEHQLAENEKLIPLEKERAVILAESSSDRATRSFEQGISQLIGKGSSPRQHIDTLLSAMEMLSDQQQKLPLAYVDIDGIMASKGRNERNLDKFVKEYDAAVLFLMRSEDFQANEMQPLIQALTTRDMAEVERLCQQGLAGRRENDVMKLFKDGSDIVNLAEKNRQFDHHLEKIKPNSSLSEDVQQRMAQANQNLIGAESRQSNSDDQLLKDFKSYNDLHVGLSELNQALLNFSQKVQAGNFREEANVSRMMDVIDRKISAHDGKISDEEKPKWEILKNHWEQHKDIMTDLMSAKKEVFESSQAINKEFKLHQPCGFTSPDNQDFSVQTFAEYEGMSKMQYLSSYQNDMDRDIEITSQVFGTEYNRDTYAKFKKELDTHKETLQNILKISRVPAENRSKVDDKFMEENKNYISENEGYIKKIQARGVEMLKVNQSVIAIQEKNQQRPANVSAVGYLTDKINGHYGASNHVNVANVNMKLETVLSRVLQVALADLREQLAQDASPDVDLAVANTDVDTSYEVEFDSEDVNSSDSTQQMSSSAQILSALNSVAQPEGAGERMIASALADEPKPSTVVEPSQPIEESVSAPDPEPESDQTISVGPGRIG